MKRPRGTKKAADPFLRNCPACGAKRGEPCKSDELPKIPRATRLVHAARLEGATDA